MSEARSPFAATPAAPQRIQFSILQLVFWTAGAGLLLSFAQTQDRSTQSPALATYFLINQFLYAIVFGWAISCLVLPFLPRSRELFPTAPGHWILLVIAIDVIVLTALHWGRYFIMQIAADADNLPHSLPMPLRLYLLLRALDGLAMFALYIMALVNSRHWKVYFGILAPLHLLSAIALSIGLVFFWSSSYAGPWLLTTPYTATTTITFVLLLCMLVSDRVHRQRRDWLHWTGAGIIVYIFVMHWTSSLVIRFLI